MKFITEHAFYHTINKWILDGSRMFKIVQIEEGTFVTLMGKDGCKEELIFYHSQEEYDRDDQSVPACEVI